MNYGMLAPSAAEERTLESKTCIWQKGPESVGNYEIRHPSGDTVVDGEGGGNSVSLKMFHAREALGHVSLLGAGVAAGASCKPLQPHYITRIHSKSCRTVILQIPYLLSPVPNPLKPLKPNSKTKAMPILYAGLSTSPCISPPIALLTSRPS